MSDFVCEGVYTEHPDVHLQYAKDSGMIYDYTPVVSEEGEIVGYSVALPAAVHTISVDLQVRNGTA